MRDLDLSPHLRMSYKRQRGPLQRVGPPIIQFQPQLPLQPHEPVICQGFTWHHKKPENAPDMVYEDLPPGHPSDRVDDAMDPLEIFEKFLPDDDLHPVVGHTNVKAEELRQGIGPGNRGSKTYSNTNLTELKAFIGCLIMAG